MARKVMKQEVGTIYQKPNGTYHYRYQINGERKSISLKTKNQEEAKRKVKELLPVLKATSMEVVSAHVAHARNLIKPANVLLLTEAWNVYAKHPNRATPATVNERLAYEADWRDFLKGMFTQNTRIVPLLQLLTNVSPMKQTGEIS